jgi:hypothetical protein
MSIYEILPALDLTQSVHTKISIGMHRGVKFKISRIPLIGLETRLGWRTDRKFLRNPNLNEIKYNADKRMHNTMSVFLEIYMYYISNNELKEQFFSYIIESTINWKTQYYSIITWCFSYWPSYRFEACCIGPRRSRTPIQQTEDL